MRDYQAKLAVQENCSGDGLEDVTEGFRNLDVFGLLGVVVVEEVEVVGHDVPIFGLDFDEPVDDCL